ncbi:C2H2 transcription factor [Apiospora phragmitis]|uniref:C2H2 transcription factor n=1 Tax=Apiospora phragmitis TaxID=2905665 RepID=A0ABR1SU87_9PEZI
MQSIQLVETAAISGNADDIAEGRQQKPKTLPCKYCSKRFRDLLVRHEKLVHLNEGTNKDGARPRKPSIAGVVDQQQMPTENHIGNDMMNIPRAHVQQYRSESLASVSVPTLAPDPRQPGRAAACNLDLLSDAATQIASANEVNSMPPMIGDMGQTSNGISRIKPYEEGLAYGDRGREPQDAAAAAITVGFPGQGASSAYEDYNLFLDDFASSSHFLPQAFETDQSPSMWPRHPTDLQRGASKPTSQFPSRFPSLQPDLRDVSDTGGRGHEDSMRAPPLRVSAMDHTVLKSRLEEFSSILPNDFIFPSRHTLTRFLEGYVSGFHDHLPILHLPTISMVDLSPELLLAILAVGAQYRFENHRGNALWYAAKAVALEQIRRRHSHEVHVPPNTPQSRMETIQALLLLFAVGLWGAKAILHEALSLQSLLALLVREEGFMAESTQTADWEAWIRIEGANRTKLIVYCFFNLCSIAYNMPPLLLTSELNILLPHSSKLWRAESAWQWQEARHAFSTMDISLQDAFSRLFSRPPQGPALYMSALGNYGLIHAVLQHIFLLKQTCFSSAPSFEAPRGLRPDDVEEVAQALRMWQMSFEQHQSRAAEMNPQNGNDPSAGGPLAYNPTALWRLASIRLYTDLSPSRTLETREAGQIAAAFLDAPYLNRSVRLNRAVLQAIHALSMLVKLGVNYVARRKSTEWSIQHSFCNLECAILLSKWLMTLASIGPSDPPASPEERNLLEMLRRMLDETEFAVPIDPSLSGSASGHPPHVDYTASDSTKLRQLAAAVTRLWAETFKGNHMLDIVKVIGNGLEGYADLLEKPRDRTPLGRLPPNGGLG